jgi:UDP-2,4-diacetamido-2,4,6-trideoxy-beta-L-altropyranose hydrolase
MRVVACTKVDQGRGFGHLSRCIAFVQAAAAAGVEARVVVSADKGIVESTLVDSEVPFSLLSAEHSVDEILVRAARTADWLFVDHYEVSPPGLAELRRKVKTVYMDDNGHLPDYPVTVVVNQNFTADALVRSGIYSSAGQVLGGPGYAMLKQQFWSRARPGFREQTAEVFVSFGGSDPGGFTEPVTRQLAEIPGLTVHAVIGPDMPADLLAEHPCVKVHRGVSDLAPLLCQADVAVMAAGSTVYEAAWARLPVLATCTVPNQNAVGAELSSRQAIRCIPEECMRTDAGGELRRLLGAPETLLRLASSLAELVDGRGGHRVLSAVLEQSN